VESRRIKFGWRPSSEAFVARPGDLVATKLRSYLVGVHASADEILKTGSGCVLDIESSEEYVSNILSFVSDVEFCKISRTHYITRHLELSLFIIPVVFPRRTPFWI
jgi:hypothetical protein